MADVVLHFLVFTVVSTVFLWLPLAIGQFLRPTLPTVEKDAIYECGEPTIGSSYIQFDLRFYTVALLFIIFDVEVVFFFPWAQVFGTAMKLTDPGLSEAARAALSSTLTGPGAAPISHTAALSLGWLGLVDLLFFFGVLLVGFAYVWKRGDLDWVRAATSSLNRSNVPAKTPTASSIRVAPSGSEVAAV